VNPVTMVFVFLSWALLTIAAIALLKKKTLSMKKAVILLAISIIIGGFVLGALPNPIQPINQLLLALRGLGVNASLIPMALALAVLLLSTLVFGRSFCGHACPLGSLQELLSRFKFKSSVAAQSAVKGAIIVPERAAKVIRVVVLVVMATITTAWGIAIIQLTSPFLGFRVFMQPGIVAIAVPIIMLVSIAIASIFAYRPWCRLGCPFGTIAWITSRFSMYKLRRTDVCTDCGLCEKVCPVDEAKRGSSKAGCFLCNRCVETCPKNAISFEKQREKVSSSCRDA
jgi:ferredoxin-type protein NapH